MSGTISLITPSYRGDLESCRLLCDSVDRYVTGYDTHYIVVGDEDLELFAPFAGAKRRVVASSVLLPPLWSLPRWRGRRYWWTPGLRLPVFGWQLQQARKIAMTLAQPNDRVMCVDSDNCFCRPFDLGVIVGMSRLPLYAAQGDINITRPHHVVWWRNAHALLGLKLPLLPGADFIGQTILWDKESVRHMVARIEGHSGRSWWKALFRAKHFSEYITYGITVNNDPALAARHQPVSESRCLTYWSGPALDAETLAAFIAKMEPHHAAIAVQSHTGTPIETIRAVALEDRPSEVVV